MPAESELELGAILVREGRCTAEQVREALGLQKALEADGKRRRLGELLVERGIVPVEEVLAGLRKAGAPLLRCSGCGLQWNVTRAEAGKTYACRTCGAPLAAVDTVTSLAAEGTLQGGGPAAAAALRGPSTKIRTTDELLSPGQELGGCRVVRLLARGGMGAVYEAVQLSLGRTVALKILPPRLARNPRFVARFERESVTLAALNHPRIVTVFDRGIEGNYFYFVMEHVTGESLRERLRRGAVPVDEACRMVSEILGALEYAHGKGVVHRDIKPENVLLSVESGLKVADFGIAYMGGTHLESSSRVDAEGSVPTTKGSLTIGGIGSRNYMAPEQAANLKSADHRVDLYALGVLFHELLTRRLPREAKEPLAALCPGIPAGVAAFLEKLTSVLPEDRFDTAAAARTELARVCEEEAVAPAGAGVREAADRGAPSSSVAAAEPRTGPLARVELPAAVSGERTGLVSTLDPRKRARGAPMPIVVWMLVLGLAGIGSLLAGGYLALGRTRGRDVAGAGGGGTAANATSGGAGSDARGTPSAGAGTSATGPQAGARGGVGAGALPAGARGGKDGGAKETGSPSEGDPWRPGRSAGSAATPAEPTAGRAGAGAAGAPVPGIDAAERARVEAEARRALAAAQGEVRDLVAQEQFQAALDRFAELRRQFGKLVPALRTELEPLEEELRRKAQERFQAVKAEAARLRAAGNWKQALLAMRPVAAFGMPEMEAEAARFEEEVRAAAFDASRAKAEGLRTADRLADAIAAYRTALEYVEDRRTVTQFNLEIEKIKESMRDEVRKLVGALGNFVRNGRYDMTEPLGRAGADPNFSDFRTFVGSIRDDLAALCGGKPAPKDQLEQWMARLDEVRIDLGDRQGIPAAERCRACGGEGEHGCGRCRGKKQLPGACPACRREGKVACGECHGKGRSTCTACGGRGSTTKRVQNKGSPCPGCQGKGQVQVRPRVFTVCTECGGSGDETYDEPVRCAKCSGSGRMPCPNCSGSGKNRCGRCNGTGETFVDCPDCEGVGHRPCMKCKGSGRAPAK
ncbi:MAG: protein kinase [Planctomycetes bacterium]|nr:protein kinase [Planctomycetota bacterium]